MYQWISWSFIATFHPLDLVNFCSPCKVMQLSAEFAEVHSQVVHCQAGLPNPPFLTSFGNRQISADLFKQILTAAPNQVQPDIWRLWNLSWIVWRKRWRMKLNATRPPSTRQGFSDIWFKIGTGLAPDNPGIRHKNSQQSKCDHTLVQPSWGKRSSRHDVFFAAWFESICWRSQRRAEGGRIHKAKQTDIINRLRSCYNHVTSCCTIRNPEGRRILNSGSCFVRRLHHIPNNLKVNLLRQKSIRRTSGVSFLPSVQRQAIEISTPCVKAKSQEKQEQTEQMAERLGQRLASVEQLSARLGT